MALIRPSDDHRKVNGTELVEAREGLFVSQRVFAKLCGWSQPYQCQLEVPGWHEIPTEQGEKILRVIEDRTPNTE